MSELVLLMLKTLKIQPVRAIIKARSMPAGFHLVHQYANFFE